MSGELLLCVNDEFLVNGHVDTHHQVHDMRGRRFSADIRELVSHSAKLGVDLAMIEAIAGVSKRQIQRIVSEEEHGDPVQDHGRHTRQRILKSEHLEVSNSNTLTIVHPFTKSVYSFFSS